MRKTPRRRRVVSPGTARILPWVGFRRSHSRDAYVLRGVGGRFGPVVRSADEVSAPEPEVADLDELNLSPDAARDPVGSRR
jgi:hypothetical protein